MSRIQILENIAWRTLLRLYCITRNLIYRVRTNIMTMSIFTRFWFKPRRIAMKLKTSVYSMPMDLTVSTIRSIFLLTFITSSIIRFLIRNTDFSSKSHSIRNIRTTVSRNTNLSLMLFLRNQSKNTVNRRKRINQQKLTPNLRKRFIQSHKKRHYILHMIMSTHFFNTSTCAFATSTNMFIVTQFFPNSFEFCEITANRTLILSKIHQFSS